MRHLLMASLPASLVLQRQFQPCQFQPCQSHQRQPHQKSTQAWRKSTQKSTQKSTRMLKCGSAGWSLHAGWMSMPTARSPTANSARLKSSRRTTSPWSTSMTYAASRSRSPRRRRLGSFTVLFAGLLALRHQTCWATCGRIVKAAHTSSLWLVRPRAGAPVTGTQQLPGPHLQQAVCGGRSEPRAARQAHGTYAWDTMGHARAWDMHGTCMGHNGTRAWDTMDMGQWDVH